MKEQAATSNLNVFLKCVRETIEPTKALVFSLLLRLFPEQDEGNEHRIGGKKITLFHPLGGFFDEVTGEVKQGKFAPPPQQASAPPPPTRSGSSRSVTSSQVPPPPPPLPRPQSVNLSSTAPPPPPRTTAPGSNLGPAPPPPPRNVPVSTSSATALGTSTSALGVDLGPAPPPPARPRRGDSGLQTIVQEQDVTAGPPAPPQRRSSRPPSEGANPMGRPPRARTGESGE
jgi:hypothetical protein